MTRNEAMGSIQAELIKAHRWTATRAMRAIRSRDKVVLAVMSGETSPEDAARQIVVEVALDALIRSSGQ